MRILRGPNRPGWLAAGIVSLSACLLPGGLPTLAQTQQAPAAAGAAISSGAQQAQPPEQQPTGIVSGAIIDKSGAAVAGAHIQLARADASSNQETTADSDGQFFFANVPPGPFQLTVTAPGFATQTQSGILHAAETYAMPPVAMAVASVVTQIEVTPAEEARVELKAEEQQRVLGVIPNFYVTYVPDAAPLKPRQKFQLAWKTTIDPVTFVVTGATAGIEQATNYYSGYGQGGDGYAKRFGASYANFAIATFIGSAILPSILKQDPRYFYKGTGSRTSRFFYAFGNTFFCKGDNGRWQPNYSNLAGTLIASGIGNAYDPPSDRGVASTFEGALIGIGATGAANVLEEFVVSKLTSNNPIKKQHDAGGL